MNAPTLIVGLGGKGSDVVLRVSKMINEEQRQRIGFAVFDTDVNELRVIRQNNPHVHTIQTSTKLSVGEYLDIDTHARDTWFPVNAILNSKTLTEGAGQVRAVSRLAFETAVRSGKMEELHKAIEELYELEGDEYSQALRVIIVSSLAGGTGSGLILPVALYIKNYLATRFRQSANITRGFFLLPEVFYGVVTGQAERNNLKSNAYATLREIDAFLMKGDATLPKRYDSSVCVEFPSVASNEYEQYNIRPYDFCFLFDAQNADGKKLSSFNEYLDHAANCIYAQSIGPMNKRSNSSEDNTIRKLAAERGRNRYAGAGTSMLTYPTADVRRYLALNWAKESVSDVWLMFDREFSELQKRNAEKRRSGIHTQDLKRGASYISSVEANAKSKKPFAMSVVDSCITYEDNGAVAGRNWTEYLNALEAKISADSETTGEETLLPIREAAATAISGIEVVDGDMDSVWDSFVEAYNHLQAYYRQVTKHTDMVSSSIAYAIFHTDEENAASQNEKFQLERYMRNSEGKFNHPCAVRYFLYNVQKGMYELLEDMKRLVKNEEDYFEAFERVTFDDSETDEKETVNDLSRTKKVTLMDRIRRRLSADQEDLIAAYRNYLNMADELKMHSIFQAVLEEGITYVDSLINAYERFFDSLDSRIGSISKEIKIIEGKYAHMKGQASRYVCASAKCLNSMKENMPYTGGTIELDTKLCETIYNRVRAYTLLSVRSENGEYFHSLFNKDIIGYYEKELLEVYGPEVNMDIITAIEKEAELEAGKFDEDDVRKYVVDVINSAKVLAAPFIEKPMGEEKDPINSCAFNKKLKPDDESPRAKLIEQELFNFGGEADDDIPLDQILFYKSFYGLRANDLSKFAPPQKGKTYDRSAGEYFKAYYELVSKIHPDPTVSTVITPHIDRWWHIVTKMPDLDDGNQALQIDRIYAAFFWGFVDGFIELFDDYGEAQKIYRIAKRVNNKNEKGITLMVTNRTSCDRLYEVLDALTIYPELVDGILQSVQDEIDRELEDGKTYKNNDLVEACNNIRIRQINDSKGEERRRSIFEFPFLLRASMKSDQYEEEDALRMAEVIVAETGKCIQFFCQESEYGEVLSSFYQEQFDLLLENFEKNGSRNTMRVDFLFKSVCSLVTDTLEDLNMRKAAKEIRNKCREFTQE